MCRRDGAAIEACGVGAGAWPGKQQALTTLSPGGVATGRRKSRHRRAVQAGARARVRGAGQPTTATVAPSAWPPCWRRACGLRGRGRPWHVVEGSPCSSTQEAGLGAEAGVSWQQVRTWGSGWGCGALPVHFPSHAPLQQPG